MMLMKVAPSITLPIRPPKIEPINQNRIVLRNKAVAGLASKISILFLRVGFGK